MRQFYILLIMVFILPQQVLAQNEHKYGTLSGSFETNTIYYIKDSKLGDVIPTDRFGSNNYIKFDYTIGSFRAGLGYEAYLPVLQGYPMGLKESDIVYKYITFQDFNLNVTIGDFFDQFGSGLLFRSYEERTLGINNSVEGVRVQYRFNDLGYIRGIWGRPRKYMDRSESQVRGIDLSLSLSTLLKMNHVGISIEGSFLNRYQSYTGTQEDVKENVDGWSGRFNIDYKGLLLKGEYVEKDVDPALYNNYLAIRGKALLGEFGLVDGNFGTLISFRRLENMSFYSERDLNDIGMELNYLPALTRQYTYMLALLNPYSTQVNSEIGGQIDCFYNFKSGTFLGGRYGTKIAANFSTYYNLDGDPLNGYTFWGKGDEMLYQDFSVDFIKQWNKKFKTIFQYIYQKYNPIITGYDSAEWKSQIAIADLLWKFSLQNSLRLELQHLWTGDDKKNWAAGLLEFNVAPRWSIFVSDMWNYDETDMHYYNGGISYTHSRTRIALNYGRTKAGYTCAGGVCRATPAYSGLNLQLTASF